MHRKKMLTCCLTLVVLTVAVAGIFYYMSYVKSNNNEMKGTLVQAFTQKVNECRL